MRFFWFTLAMVGCAGSDDVEECDPAARWLDMVIIADRAVDTAAVADQLEARQASPNIASSGNTVQVATFDTELDVDEPVEMLLQLLCRNADDSASEQNRDCWGGVDGDVVLRESALVVPVIVTQLGDESRRGLSTTYPRLWSDLGFDVEAHAVQCAREDGTRQTEQRLLGEMAEMTGGTTVELSAECAPNDIAAELARIAELYPRACVE